MDELRQLITDPSKCPECSYTGDKLEAVSRHLALFHCKLDEFLQNDELVAAKRAKAMAKPKKVKTYDQHFKFQQKFQKLILLKKLTIYCNFNRRLSLN
jgi:hypothetical protein